MMSQQPTNGSDAERQHVAEPTKYIVRCCELRKRREIKSASVSSRPRVRVTVEN